MILSIVLLLLALNVTAAGLDQPAEHSSEATAHDAGADHSGPSGSKADHHAAEDAHAEHNGDTHHEDDHGGAHGDHGSEEIPLIKWLACIPFVVLLLCIAILPLMHKTEHWWEDNKNRLFISLVLSAIVLLFYWTIHPGVVDHHTHEILTGHAAVEKVLEHAVLDEYIPFITLLFSLYVISGGIQLKGDLPAHPMTNTAFIGIGALIASFIGTTGAAMLLIRPLLQTNRERKHVTHTVIFFIFLVCNCGGCLLPIGDPPLFLGYLRGVPFEWTLALWPQWLAVNIVLLVVYLIWDSMAYKKETIKDIIKDETQVEKLQLRGQINFLFLLGVVFCVAFLIPGKPLFGNESLPVVPNYFREFMQMVFVGASLFFTPRGLRKENNFNYTAIGEVAALFIGIFITMQVPLEILNQIGPRMGLDQPWQFFWITGTLSSFLDNAPTYVVFFETAKTLPTPEGVALVAGLSEELLVAISLGAVFMGANTYIGNGPNFMVKSIAEQSGVKMPSFFGYMAYSVGILVPIFLVLTYVQQAVIQGWLIFGK